MAEPSYKLISKINFVKVMNGVALINLNNYSQILVQRTVLQFLYTLPAPETFYNFIDR